MTFELQTERLSLRKMDMGDLDFMGEMLSDPDVMHYYPKPLTRTEVESWINRQIQRYKLDGHGLWLTYLKQGQIPIGQVGLVLQNIDNEPLAEIGYMINKPHWRNGYAFEAANAVKSIAQNRFNYDKIVSLIRPENTPSSAVARKLKMTTSKQCEHGGYRHDLYQYLYPS